MHFTNVLEIMSDAESGGLESTLKAVMVAEKGEASVVPKAKKARKPYEWTEKRATAFQKMRDGLAMKVQVAQELKKEKKDAEKKDIKDRIAKIMNAGKRAKSSKVDSGSSSEDVESVAPVKSRKSSVAVSDSSSDGEDKCHTTSKVLKEAARAYKESQKVGKLKRKEKEVYVKESDSEESDSEEESFELASAKQKQHYRDTKVKIGKAQRSTRTLNALDNYILL